MPLTALLFDLDGTLIDSDPLHFRAFRVISERYGQPDFDEAFFARHISGHSNAEICKALWPDLPQEKQMAMADEKEALFRSMLSGAAPVAGLPALLDWSHEHRLALAVVSNAPLANLQAVVDALGIGRHFAALISGDELGRGKPDPLPYRTALQRLGTAPAAAVAFEDAAPGITAAVGAGIPTVGIATTQPNRLLMEYGASVVVQDFADALLRPYLEARRRLP